MMAGRFCGANLTVRTHCKRLARLTLAFSKKLPNFKAAFALHLAYYNLVKTHGTVRCTPAMAAGIESIPPVDSPQTAVKVAIAAKARR